MSQDSAVSIVAGYRPKGLECPGRDKIFLLSTLSRPVLGPTKVSYPMGNEGSFSGGKVAEV
jgi:hypothetical protein